MPRVYGVFFSGKGEYDYSEGMFYTVSPTNPVTKQLVYMSSGSNSGNIYKTDEQCLRTMLKDINDELDDPYGDWRQVDVHLFNADDNDFCFRFSGPPSTEPRATYAIDHDHQLVHRSGPPLMEPHATYTVDHDHQLVHRSGPDLFIGRIAPRCSIARCSIL